MLFLVNKKYAFDTVAYSEWLTSLREEILKDTEKRKMSEIISHRLFAK